MICLKNSALLSAANKFVTMLVAVTSIIALSSQPARALLYSDTAVLFLYGNNYELGDKSQTLFTFEHANAWAYGDNFFFLDIFDPTKSGERTDTNLYAEFSPRLSVGKILHRDLAVGPITDFLVATNFEFADGVHNQLYGVGLDIEVPLFTVFQLNYYAVKKFSSNDIANGQQLTWAWLLPFEFLGVKMRTSGFVDYEFGASGRSDNIQAQPRLLVDLGDLWGKPGHLFGGVEYQYWENKFGLDGFDESTPQIGIRWKF